MKNLKFLAILLGIVGFFTACSPGYVASVPVYVEGVRPVRPSPAHIWVEGNWNWNRQTHAYVRHEGTWALSNNHRSYGQGQWKSNSHGNYWEKGRRN